jgi:hypothetical protein
MQPGLDASGVSPRRRSVGQRRAGSQPPNAFAADPHAHAPLATSRERSRRHARAKPCLAGRPTALVRTQIPETNTSRGRPSGMELPDYPVVVLTPAPLDQDGPAPPLPARSFPGFVARSASRRVFSRIRSSFRFPPGLFPYSLLVPLPAGSFPGFVARSASQRVVSQIRQLVLLPSV